MNFKLMFFTFLVKPFILMAMGLNVRNQDKLPNGKTPKIIIANHNSHLDTLALMSLFPNRVLNKIRPVGAKDYFFSNKISSWLSTNLLTLIPLDRKTKGRETLEGIYEALDNGDTVILFPEGSRGTPEELSKFKNGIHHIIKNRPNIPIVPIFMEGMGKSLPKNEALFVPFIGNINIGEDIYYDSNIDRDLFLLVLENSMKDLKSTIKDSNS